MHEGQNHFQLWLSEAKPLWPKVHQLRLPILPPARLTVPDIKLTALNSVMFPVSGTLQHSGFLFVQNSWNILQVHVHGKQTSTEKCSFHFQSLVAICFVSRYFGCWGKNFPGYLGDDSDVFLCEMDSEAGIMSFCYGLFWTAVDGPCSIGSHEISLEKNSFFRWDLCCVHRYQEYFRALTAFVDLAARVRKTKPHSLRPFDMIPDYKPSYFIFSAYKLYIT